MKETTKKKLLIVVESINVEDSSGSKANVALIKNLHKAGFILEVHHYTRKKINLEGIVCIEIKEKKWNLLYFLSRIQRYVQNYLGIIINKPLENIFGFSFTFFNDTKSISNHLRQIQFFPDMILTLSKGASFRPHYSVLQLPEYHEKWLAYIHDPYPFYYYPPPYQWKEPGYKQKIEFFRNLSFRCTWAAFPSLLLSDWMTNFFSDFSTKSLIIPHQIDTSFPPDVALPTFFDSEKFNIVHAGNLMKQRSPAGLIDGYQKFLDQDPSRVEKTNLLFLGSSSSHKNLFLKIKQDVPNIFVSKGVPFDQVQALQAEAAVNVIIESKATISPFLPGKFTHCIQADKPILVLGPSNSEVRRLLGEDYPFWSEVDNGSRIAEILEVLFLNWQNSSPEKKNTYSSIKFYLSFKSLRQEFNKILENE